jgi:hypothetical protein
MADLNKAIESHIRNVIALPKRDITSAANSREWFLERIFNEIESRSNEPVLHSEKPFVYYGSYFKGTKVAMVDEFDVLVVIDSNTGVFRKGGQEIGRGMGDASPNHKYAQKYKKEDGSGVSPAKMLNWLKGVVQTVVDCFDGQAPERAGQAVTAEIISQNLKIDLVPAGMFRRTTDSRIFCDIPRGDKENGWILTAPEDDMARLEKLAQNRSNFRNVIRVAKRIADTRNFTVPSFAIETAVVNYAYNATWYNQLDPDLPNVLTWIARQFRAGRIIDPFDTTANLLADVASLSWYAERLEDVVAELSACRNILNQADANERVRRILENEW